MSSSESSSITLRLSRLLGLFTSVGVVDGFELEALEVLLGGALLEALVEVLLGVLLALPALLEELLPALLEELLPALLEAEALASLEALWGKCATWI